MHFKNLGLNFIEEFHEHFNFDFAIPERRTIIEYNGPTHYILPKLTLNQSSKFRKKFIENRGWKMLSIPCFYENPN